MAEKKLAEEKDFRHLVRIANTDLKGEKSILYALLKVKGVGIMLANAVLRLAGVDANTKAGYLEQKDVEKIDKLVSDVQNSSLPLWLYNRRKDYETGEDRHLLISDLKFQKENDIKRLRKIKSYRGSRHAASLPVRGQRTKSNFRGKGRKSLGVKRKK